MVSKLTHIMIDVIGIGALAYAASDIAVSLGVAVAGLGLLLLHAAVSGGSYRQDGDE